ncbi:MAG: 23S rRNA (guanosine(2251)-2'-O)-methyltransferase RlmB [Actinobacteria bacterium]|nr:MAG: 23S rRNA (guanosine(2251)-2'-O)-methyltransferase RlmB [Actinomycetota bacterium]
MSDLVEGRNAVAEALSAGLPIERVLIAEGVKPDAAVERVRSLAAEHGVPVEQCPRRKLDAMSDRGAHQGVAALARPFAYADLDSVLRLTTGQPRSLIIALDHVTDPGNLGAVARSAEAVGAAALVIEERRSAQVTAAAFKASAGAVAHLPVARVSNLSRALARAKDAGYWVAGASEHAEQDAWASPLEGRIVLVMGAEGEGLSRLVRENCDFLVRLPVEGHVGSLNVAQAATVLMYEWVRRGLTP